MLAEIKTAIDFSRWALVSYKDDTGLGRMAADARNVLGFGRQFVMPSKRLETKQLVIGDELLESSAPEERLSAILDDLQGVLLFEKPDWHPRLLKMARERGMFTAAVVLWEWFDGNNPLWRLCDLLVCPNRKALKTVQQFGFNNGILLPWALDIEALPKRNVAGPARNFVHNAGLVDADDRKGTRDVIAAFKRVRNPEIRLIIRMQRKAAMDELDSRIEVRIENSPSVRGLYEQGDVAVQPSKMEGLGFMVLEPVCAGMPTITLNVDPMREYVGRSEMLVRPRWFSRRSFASQWVSHARLRLPSIRDLAAKIEWCAQNDLASISERNRVWGASQFARTILRRRWAEAFAGFLR